MTTTTTTAAKRRAMPRARHDVQDWWVPGFRGLILTFSGLVLLTPGLNLAGTGFVFAAMAIMDGGVLLHNARDLRTIVPGVQGFIAFILGAIAILLAEGYRDALIVCAAAWAIGMGGMDIFVASRHRLMRGRFPFFIAGGIAIVGGLVLLSSLVATWDERVPPRIVLSALTLLYGAFLILVSLRRSRRRGYLSAETASHRDLISERPDRSEWAG